MCQKCNKEFLCFKDPKCPSCGANNYYSVNCKLLHLEKKKNCNVQVGFKWWRPEDGDMLKVIQDPRYSHLEEEGATIGD